MKVSQYKLTFGLLLCVIFMLILVVNIFSGFISISLPWTTDILLLWKNKRSTPANKTNHIEDRLHDHDFCSKNHDNRSWFLTDHGALLLNNTTSIYYCKIPKCGSTFLGSFVNKLFSNGKNKTSNSMFPIKRNVNISNIYSFMFVREPYSRIFSAYENKLFHPNSFFKKLGTDIVKEVRKNPSELSLGLGHDVTFTELIQYIVKFYSEGRTLNPHISAMYTLCDPCREKYDFIGKLETMTTDLVQLVKEWKTRGLLDGKKNTTERVESDTQDDRLLDPVHHMFWFHYKHKDKLSKYRLFQRTWASYQIRGYILKDYTLPYNESSVAKVSKVTFIKVIKTAVDVSKEHKSKLKDQRREALHQAYRLVPIKLLEKLRQYLQTDCKLFGYENRPSWIFNKSEWTQLSDHDYFEYL